MLGTNQLRIMFTCVYIFLDLVYNSVSLEYHNKIIQKIQGEPMPSNLPIVAALGAYIAMGLGWYFLAAGTALHWYRSTSLNKWQAGLLAGVLYGFVLNGTYNFTNLFMFKNYDYHLVMRDISWAMLLSGITVMTFMILHE